MEECICNLLTLVGRIFMVPAMVVIVAVVAAGWKKILGEVWAERRKRPPTESS